MATGCAKSNEGPGVATAASGGPKAPASPSASVSVDPDAPIKYARCMRENGMTWFPDPQDGKTVVRVPSNVNREQMQAAEEACREYAPNGGEKPEIDPADLERARQMAKCMRENGVPNFPDPNAEGGIGLDREKLGTGPGDPTFDEAEKKCSQYLPQGGRERHVEGPGEVGA